MTDPAAAVASAMTSFRGRRTGVLLGERGSVAVGNKYGLEDMNGFWETAESPPTEVLQPSKTENSSKPSKSREDTKKRSKPRFSLPNTTNGEGNPTASSRELNKYLARVVASDGKKASWSPSDLSRVSTAPPTPLPFKDANEAETETKIDDLPLSPEGVRASSEDAFGDSPEIQQAQAQMNPHTNEKTQVESPAFDQDFGFDDNAGHLSDDGGSAASPVIFSPVDGDKDLHDEPMTTSPGVVDLPNEVGDNKEEDDTEGAGVGAMDGPDTPEAVPEEAEHEKSDAGARKAKVKKSKRGKRKSVRKEVSFSSPIGYPAGNRDYQVIPVSDYKESPPTGVRRSKRARFPVLAHWRNEQLVFEAHSEEGQLGDAMGDMPVVTGVMTALPTPYKKRKVPASKPPKKAKTRQSDVSEDSPFDDRKIRKKHEYADGEIATLWDDAMDDTNDMKVVSLAQNIVSTKLPLPKTRRKGEGKVVGEAAQAFNIPTDEDEMYMGYIMGQLVLPPRGIKDHEAVGGCSQTFTVCQCQPNSVEVAYADPHGADGSFDPDTAQRFLLSPGDMFRVPPGNVYRIQNHSRSTASVLTWTIIRPRTSDA